MNCKGFRALRGKLYLVIIVALTSACGPSATPSTPSTAIQPAPQPTPAPKPAPTPQPARIATPNATLKPGEVVWTQNVYDNDRFSILPEGITPAMAGIITVGALEPSQVGKVLIAAFVVYSVSQAYNVWRVSVNAGVLNGPAAVELWAANEQTRVKVTAISAPPPPSEACKASRLIQQLEKVVPRTNRGSFNVPFKARLYEDWAKQILAKGGPALPQTPEAFLQLLKDAKLVSKGQVFSVGGMDVSGDLVYQWGKPTGWQDPCQQ